MDVKETSHHYAGVLIVTESGRLIGQQRDNKVNIDNPGKVATFGVLSREAKITVMQHGAN